MSVCFTDGTVIGAVLDRNGLRPSRLWVTDDGLIIEGKPTLAGGTVSSAGDHRIARSAAVASVACQAPVTITGAEATAKSYPAFFEDMATLGFVCNA